jgi:cysteine sulfinate desulfinase/cysteine desulfurase-like protein
MGFERNRSLSALRPSLGRWTTRDDIDTTVELLSRAVDQSLGGDASARTD